MLADRVRESVLQNGLKVLTAEDSASPTASLQVWYRVGSRHEGTGITGISHLFEHLMFKGTPRFPTGVFDRILQENGMTNNAFTSHDFTAYFESLAADRLEIAMELEADRMQGLELEEEAFRSELAVIREERRQTVEDPPFGLLSEALEATVFQVHPYHWPIIGWMSDLETIRLEDVRRYYRDRYRPNNAVLVVAGDISHDQVLEQAQRHFGPIPAGPDLPRVEVREPEQRGERTVTVHKQVQLPGVLIAYRAPEAARREAKVLDVIEYLLLHGRSSRLYRRLIYEEQLATGLAGGMHLRVDPSTFTFRAMARPGVALERLQEVLYQSLEELAGRALLEAELDKVRNAMESDHVFSQEDHFEMAQNLGEEECRSTWRNYLTWLEERLSVTPQEIQTVAAETFTDRNRTVGYLIPEAEAQ